MDSTKRWHDMQWTFGHLRNKPVHVTHSIWKLSSQITHFLNKQKHLESKKEHRLSWSSGNLCKEHAFEGRRAVLNMSRVLKESSATLKQEITLFIKQDIIIPWVKKKKWNRKQNLSSKTTRIIFVLAHVIRRWKHKHLSFLGKEHQNGTGPLSVLKQNLIKLHSSLFRLLNLHLRRKLLSGLNKCNLFCSKFVFVFTGYFHSIEYINSVLHLL